MKVILKCILLFLTIAICQYSLAQNGSLVIKKSSIDIGILKEGKIAQINFEVENTSATSYRIYSVTSTCGCTIPKYPNAIGPKQKIVITATFNSKGFQGPVKKELVLVTNDSLRYYKMEFLAKVIK